MTQKWLFRVKTSVLRLLWGLLWGRPRKSLLVTFELLCIFRVFGASRRSAASHGHTPISLPPRPPLKKQTKLVLWHKNYCESNSLNCLPCLSCGLRAVHVNGYPISPYLRTADVGSPLPPVKPQPWSIRRGSGALPPPAAGRRLRSGRKMGFTKLVFSEAFVGFSWETATHRFHWVCFKRIKPDPESLFNLISLERPRSDE